MTYGSEHLMRQPKKKFFVEKALWECIQGLVAHILENDDSIENEEALVATAMHFLQVRGYAICGKRQRRKSHVRVNA